MKKDKTQNFWFKRKRYGYGWVPSAWQGWLSILVFLAVVIGGTVVLRDAPRNEFSKDLGIYLIIVLIAILGLLFVSLKKGPSPKWRLGKDSRDDPNEDH